ncbi:MAG: M1 family peptidase [Anaerolineales bacterium]|nr:M1 family peptidase [Anaerolineales bacterium]
MPFTDPHSYVDIEQGKIKHIDFVITTHFKERTLHVVASYTLDRPVTGPLFLDIRDINIEYIRQDEEELAWEIDREDPILGQRLHIKDLDQATELTIGCSTSPEASALQWLKPGRTAGGKHPFLYSQCQALHARSIFPCQDTPSIRFTYSAVFETPPPLVPVMGAAIVEEELSILTNFRRFDMQQPIPSYLFALVVGNLGFYRLGPRCGVYAEPEAIDDAAWEFAENEDKLVEAEKLYGPYVWERYDIIVLPPSFPYGGMENPRLTFLNPLYLVGDRSLTTIITHELAHAWTGNLVTNATWEDFWLNEGWTTYAEARITEAIEGRDIAQLKAATSRSILLEDMNRYGMDSTLTCLTYPVEGLDPDEIFSSIPYHKGKALLERMEQAVGRTVFDEFIHKYINTFKFQSLTTSGFLAFVDQELPQVREKVNLEEWIYQPGLPEDAPTYSSTLLEQVTSVVKGFMDGKRPTQEEIDGWEPPQIPIFLRMLPHEIPTDDCHYLDDLFKFKDSQNVVNLTYFYVIALHSDYRDVMPRIESLLANFGRHFLTSKVYRAMVQVDWARDEARPIFERYRERHHPITVAYIDNLLKEAGL